MITVPDAPNSACSPPDDVPAMRSDTVCPCASFICDAIVRIQISSYIAYSSRVSSPCTSLRRPERVAGGADRLVRLLRVLHLALVAARRLGDVVGAVELGRLRAGGGERGLGQRRRVGAHVGDVAVLVEALRDAHRRLRGVAELAARLLLERRGHERRARLARVRLALDPGDAEGRLLEPLRETARGLPRRAGSVSGLRSWPSLPKSRPCARRLPSTETRRASNDSGSKVASMSHQLAARNARRSRSRSTTSRVATDCTRPAESPRMIFFQRTGETS